MTSSSFPIELLRQSWVLAGPTAVGKTALSLQLADRLGAEIVALDSMTVYRGMDIGTAKPSVAERAIVPHHLIDIREPHEDFSLTEFLAAATDACRGIQARGRVPLFVGGTGLYLRGLLRGVFEGPAADWDLRHRLEAEAEANGEAALHQRLATVDPVSAARLHPRDLRRVIRALEVFELTGQPLSALQQQQPLTAADRPRLVAWLQPETDSLNQRIDARVSQMMRDGLIEEVRHLLERQPPLSHTAQQALGYQEVIAWLTGGRPVPMEELIAEIQLRTRQFAKRQRTWFRNLEECVAIPVHAADTTETLVERFVAAAHPRC